MTIYILPCIADTLIASSSANTNFGTEAYMSIGFSTVNYYGLVKFNLALLPAGTINSATMSLWAYQDAANQNSTWNLRRLLRNWGETTATYNKYDGTNAWGTAGGIGATDIDAGTMGTLSVANNKAIGQWDITVDTVELHKMHIGTYQNYGWNIVSSMENTSLWAVRSREYATSGNRPILTVDLTPKSIPGAIWF